jgi:hypothetical protein
MLAFTVRQIFRSQVLSSFEERIFWVNQSSEELDYKMFTVHSLGYFGRVKQENMKFV